MFEVGKTFSCVLPHFSHSVSVTDNLRYHEPRAPTRNSKETVCLYLCNPVTHHSPAHSKHSIHNYGFEALADLLTIENDFQNSDKGIGRDPTEMAALMAHFVNF